MADVKELKVEKKDGKMWDFERGKILTSITNAGADPEQAEQVTQEVENWARSGEADSVKTSDLRAKVLELLKTANPDAAKSYESYVKLSQVQENAQ